MTPDRIVKALRRFWSANTGTVAVETVIMVPLLITGLVFSHEFFGYMRLQSLQDKASYTVADTLARETTVVDDAYIDNAKALFDMLTDNAATSQMRISVVRYHFNESANIDEYELRWTELRGAGDMTPLSEADVRSAHDMIPQTHPGQDLIMVETRSIYTPVVSATNGLIDGRPVTTRVFMPLRFAPQLCFTGVCEPT